MGQWASIELTSSPNSAYGRGAGAELLEESLLLRRPSIAGGEAHAEEEAGMATTPSTSATSQSPGATVASPSTITPPVAPGPVLEAPRNPAPRANTGNRCFSSAPRSRTVPSMTSPTIPAASAAVVKTSPQYPRTVSSPTETAKTEPRGAGDGGVYGQVVPGSTGHREGRAGDGRPRPDGPDARM